MLVVAAVIMTVAVVSLPAITSISKSSSRQMAASLVISTFDQARSLALSQSGVFYLVFADKSMTVSGQNTVLGQPYSYRAFAIFQETYNTVSQKYDRLQVTNWTILPAGVAFDPDLSNSDTIFCNTPLTEGFYCKPLGQDGVVLPCFKFNSLGSLDEPADSRFAQVRIFEGFVDANGGPTFTKPGGQLTEEIISVSLVTGRAIRLNP